jgi:hypothetical protein
LTRSTFETKGRSSGLFYGIALAAAVGAGPAWSFGCSGLALGADVGMAHSVWEETSATGRLLVRERGTLTRAAITAEEVCEGWQWRLAMARSTGDRAYEGVSNINAPIQTQSALAITDASVQGWTPAISGWSGGLRLNHRRIDRDIASVGNVRGYPERFSYWQAAVGLKQELKLTPQFVISGDGWLGGGPAGKMELRLPNADATELTLGRSRVAEIGFQIGSAAAAPNQAGWSWHARVDYQWQRMAAGPAKALTRNGVPVGGAAQPATQQKTAALGVGLRYQF